MNRSVQYFDSFKHKVPGHWIYSIRLCNNKQLKNIFPQVSHTTEWYSFKTWPHSQKPFLIVIFSRNDKSYNQKKENCFSSLRNDENNISNRAIPTFTMGACLRTSLPLAHDFGTHLGREHLCLVRLRIDLVISNTTKALIGLLDCAFYPTQNFQYSA